MVAVVSTIVSLVLFARFRTVEHIKSGERDNFFLVLQLMMSQRKLYMVGICLNVRKRVKRTWDAIVETTAAS